MNTAFGEEEDDQEEGLENATPVRELTLSNTMLVGMLFALLLVCGLFFGWGFSIGRRVSPGASQDRGLTGSAAAAAAAEATAQPASISTSQTKPSAVSQTASTSPSDVQDAAPDLTQSVEPDSEQTTASPSPSQAPRPAYVSVQTPLTAKTQTPAFAAPGSMVQIAAVSNAADANVLVGALRKHGYTVSVRRDPADTLIHVQVGPFASHDEAIAMRQRLLSDGYNAILK